MIAKLLPASTILAAAVLAMGYGLGGLWVGALLCLALGDLWLLAQRRAWNWSPSAMLAVLTGLAAIGIWLNANPDWMLVGAVAALCTWDLNHFTQRVGQVGRMEEAPELERHHLQRLLLVALLGLLLGAIALRIEITLGFGMAMLLALLAVLALSRAIRTMRREGD
jgi:hypothetical protein